VAENMIKDIAQVQPYTQMPHRAERFPNLVGQRRNLHVILDELEATIIGAGSVGRPICLHFAQLQPRSLTIVDPGIYKSENLLNQQITSEAIGRSKAEVVGELCAQISPRTRVRVFAGRVEDLPMTALCSSSIVMLATDNLGAEVDVAQRSLHASVPLVQASVAGEMLVAQIRFCENRESGDACIACGYGLAEWQHLHNETRFSCQGGEYSSARPQPVNGAPTRSFSFLCAIAADLAMVQVIRFLEDLGQPVVNTLLEYCGYTHRTAISPLKRNEDCPCEHRCWTRCETTREIAAYTPRELAKVALGTIGSLTGISLTFPDLQFCTAGICTGCRSNQPIEKFVGALRGSGKCAVCGGSVDGLPFYAHRPTPLSALGERIDRPLHEIVDGSPEAVVVRGPQAAVLCEYPGGK
jgi:molybdopterin/thiamine biosynthesis adenylyltransferase